MATLGEVGKMDELIGAYGVFFDDPDALPEMNCALPLSGFSGRLKRQSVR